MSEEIKNERCASYVLPIRIKDGKKQVALLGYGPHEYGKIGGRFEDGEIDARAALRRELSEELNPGADKIADIALQISEPYFVDIDHEWAKIRRARKERRYIFVAQISPDMELSFCEHCHHNAHVVWLDVKSLLNENIIKFSDERTYLEKYVMPIIRNMK